MSKFTDRQALYYSSFLAPMGVYYIYYIHYLRVSWVFMAKHE